MKKIFTAKRPHLLALNVVNFCNFAVFSGEICGFLAPSVTYFNDISYFNIDVNSRSALNLAVNICRICNLAVKKFW